METTLSHISQPDLFDLSDDPGELDGQGIVDYLDRRVASLISQIEASDVWKTIHDPETSAELIAEIMKEVYLEIVMYQPDVIEATIAIIGQFPRSMEVGLIDEMLHHQVEEFNHGEMALQDYLALGGSETEARNRRMSPTAFSVAATWRFLCHKRDPFAYLGALYLFEGLTPIVTGRVKGHLAQRGLSPKALGFIEYHSTADLEHTEIVKRLIAQIADQYPESKTSICYGLEYFMAVYPVPGWQAALKRAKNRIQEKSNS